MNALQISWVLAAEDSARLAAFYSELFQATLKPGLADHHCIVQFSDGSQLEIYKPSRRRSFRQGESAGALFAPPPISGAPA